MKVNGKFAALAGAALLLGSAAFAQANTDYELPEGFSFKNVVSSDVIKMRNTFSDSTDDDKDSWKSELQGVEEKLEINYNSEKLAFQFAPKVKIGEVGSQSDLTEAKVATDDTAIFYSGMDWNFRFSPFDSIDIFLKNGNGTPGAGMYVSGAGAPAGDLGSDGLTIIAKPIDGLKLAATVPFGFDVVSEADFFNAEIADDAAGTLVSGEQKKVGKVKFNLGLGAEYAFGNLFTVGATWKDVLDADNMKAGIYFDVTAIQNVSVHVGYTFAKQGNDYNFANAGVGAFNGDYAKIFGQHFVNVSGKVAIADFTIAADVGFNLMSNQSLYDLYAGLSVGYDIVPGKFNLGLLGYVGLDLGTSFLEAGDIPTDPSDDEWKAYSTSFQKRRDITDTSKAGSYNEYASASWFNEDNDQTLQDWATAPIIGVKPSITYTSGNHTFSAAACFDYILNAETTNFAKFPVSWTYSF